MFYLLRYPETYKKLKQELDQAFPTGEIAADQHASLGELPYLGAVVNEGLRFGSGFPGFPRVVPKGGAMLEGQFVPEGTIVGVPTYAQHISPENYWPTPREFKPERWFKDGLGPGTIARQSTLMAFQFGEQQCVHGFFIIDSAFARRTIWLCRENFGFASDEYRACVYNSCLRPQLCTRLRSRNVHEGMDQHEDEHPEVPIEGPSEAEAALSQ